MTPTTPPAPSSPDPVRKIEEVYAFFVQNDVAAQETICAFRENDLWIPMVTIDWQRVEKMMPHARNIAAKWNTTIRLVKFNQREELELIEPPAKSAAKPSLRSSERR